MSDKHVSTETKSTEPEYTEQEVEDLEKERKEEEERQKKKIDNLDNETKELLRKQASSARSNRGRPPPEDEGEGV